MSKKATVIWRYILGTLIIVLSVVMIIGLTSCESVDTDDYQETSPDETESKTESNLELVSGSESELELESDSNPESEPEKVILETKKVEGVITEFYRIPSEKYDHYLFKLEGSDELYKFYSDDPTILEVGMQVSIEYLSNGEGSIKLVSKIEKTSF